MQLTDYASQIIRERRSIYTNMFSGKPVEDRIIEEMLESAQWAPTHKLTQPWRFTVFSGQGLQKLANFQADSYKKTSMEEGNFDETKFIKLLGKPLECSHIIAIGMHPDPLKRIPEIEEVCAVACAVQNMWLLASAYKIGCYWSTGGITFKEGVAPFFNWKNEDQLLGFLFIGMPKNEKWPEGKRDKQMVTWVTS